MESGEFEIVVDRGGDVRRIAVRGDLDLATVDSLRPELDDAIDAGKGTTLVLADCTFLDSSALKVIADASRRAGESGTVFALSRPSPQVARVLELSGLGEIVTIEAADYP
ncbi:MAG TPA: STAS domain-containing protein [Gaiella sp.]|nr:STAS domain-containing protein [Gaiella sp.]